ncbi:MAG: nuclease-related domain-containing protein [Actinomycetota bacterium]
MRVEQLSCYVAEQLAAGRRSLEAARSRGDAARATAGEAEARARRATSARRRRFRIRPSEDERAAALAVEAAEAELAAAAADITKLEQRIRGLEQGEAGEAVLAQALAAAFDDRWLLLQGYVMRRGEADAVVVGPTGLWMIEVKNQRGVVNAKSAATWRKQSVRNGRVGRSAYAAEDGGGRSWGQQIDGPAQSLRWWLDKKNVIATVRTAVVLTHPEAYLIVNRNPGVDLLTDEVAELVERLETGDDTLPPDLQAEIEDLIRDDHTFQIERTRKRS